MTKIIISIIFLALFLLPAFSYAAECSSSGATVIYINGIFTEKSDANFDKELLKNLFKQQTNQQDVNFLTGYNESHIGGLGDIVKVLSQMQKGNASLDYDLTNILRQVNKELSTRKVLLVGHSQGTFYTNEAYRYLIWSGVPKESIAVYNIATPADKVAGNGRYLTSETDKVIRAVAVDLAYQGFVKMPLPPNIYIPLNHEEFADKYGGHSMSGVYLKNAPDRIIKEMKKALDNLSVSSFNFNQPPDGGCFFAPEITASYYVKKVSFIAGDGAGAIGSKIKAGAVKVKDVAVSISDKIYGVTEYIFWEIIKTIKEHPDALLASIQLGSVQSPAAPAENPSPQNQTAPPEDKNFVRSDLTKFTGTGGPTQDSVQDQVDDILEKIDILQRKIADIKEEQKTEKLKNKGTEELKNEEVKEFENVKTEEQRETMNIAETVNSSGGSAIYYGKILISEVQIGGANDSKEEFVELYNMETKEIDLTDWYLQRKTKTGLSYSSFAPNTLFFGKKIAARSYFLIARTGYFSGLGDIFTDNPLTDDNTLVLKNPGGEISDKVGWGAAQDYELIATQNPSASSRQTIGRKIVSNEPQDTDVNSVDFELGNPTPKTQNVPYSPPSSLSSSTDTAAPQVVFNLNAVQEQLSFAVDFTITDPLGVVSPSGVANYIFRWKEESGAWNEDTQQQIVGDPVSHNSKREFSGDDEKIYYFQVKAKDAAGNESDWLPETPAETKISVFKKVLINEIQIEGATTKDEFIELYNPNNIAVSLENWSIQKHGKDDPCSINKSFYKKNFIAGASIPAKGYFLIVSTQADDSLKNIADMTAGWSLSDNGTIYLVKSQNKIIDGNDLKIVDKTGFGEKSCFPETSFAPNPPEEKSIERKIIGGDTDNNSADFRISANPTPKASFMQIGIKDATNYDSNFGSHNEANFYRLSLEWSSRTPDIASYDIQYKINDGDWKNWLENTTDTKGDFIAYYSVLIVKNVYSFRARSKDINGSQSDWTQVDVDLSVPVVINEFALFGTNADRGDIWIELYNRSDKDIDLTGWYWKSNDSRISLSGIIPANGYFVLEKKDDNPVSDLAANQVFAETLTATGLAGIFGSNNRTMDYFPMPSGGWQEHHFKQGDNFYSVERISPRAEGMYSQNWRMNNGVAINGFDRNGNQIFGTPGQQNSAYQLYTLLPAGFGVDVILPKNLSPYLVKDTTRVSENAVMTIEPGSVIKFYSNTSALIINGTLSAVGNDAEKIVFTSFADDNYGGDSNGEGSASSPMPGNWLGIQFTKTSKNSILENIIVRYGGATIGFSPPNWGQAVWVEQSTISLKNSLFEKNLNRAVSLDNSDSIIDSVKFVDNNATNFNTDDTYGRAINIKGGRPSVKNSYFENNRTGIYIASFYDEPRRIIVESFPIIENNQFVKNVFPIYWVELATPSFYGNTAENNDFNAIIFFGETSRNVILKPDLQYLIKYSTVVPENITLTIEPGVVLSFLHGGGLEINGALKAVGTSDRPIMFGPYTRDGESLSSGRWSGLQFTKTSKNSELENVEISYAGAPREQLTSGIKVNQSAISLKNSVLRTNANNGIWLVNSPSVIDSVQFLEHKEKTSSVDARGIFVQGGKPEIKNSLFKDNYYGIFIDRWLNEETGEYVAGEPVLDNNQFEGNIGADVYDNTPPPPPPP